MEQELINFHKLYNQHAKDVYRFSYRLTGDPDEAKDITSETFVRIWTSTAETRVESVKAYLFTIARNLYLQNKRRKKRLTLLDEEIRDIGARPDKVTEDRSELEEVLKALQTLQEIDRTVLIMRAEDARSTGLSVSTVKVKVFRARKKVHSIISTQRGGIL